MRRSCRLRVCATRSRARSWGIAYVCAPPRMCARVHATFFPQCARRRLYFSPDERAVNPFYLSTNFTRLRSFLFPSSFVYRPHDALGRSLAGATGVARRRGSLRLVSAARSTSEFTIEFPFRLRRREPRLAAAVLTYTPLLRSFFFFSSSFAITARFSPEGERGRLRGNDDALNNSRVEVPCSMQHRRPVRKFSYSKRIVIRHRFTLNRNR